MASPRFLVASPYDVITATIAAGETTSDIVDCGGMSVVGIYTPAALTGTTFTFLVSPDNVLPYYAYYDAAGTQVSKTFGASRFIYVEPAWSQGVRYFKFVSNQAEAAERTILVIVRTPF